MYREHVWNAPAIQNNYGDLWQTISHKAGLPGAIDQHQARIVHVRWRSLGKKAAAGRL